MRLKAYEKGRAMTWQAVGNTYAETFEHAVSPSIRLRTVVASTSSQPLPPLDHLHRMTGPHGLFQHAWFAEPNLAHGYCTDDNARATICLTDYQRAGSTDERLPAMFESSFRFLLNACNLRTGRFRNFMDQHGAWLEEFGSEDSHGRALWALGHVARHHSSVEVQAAALKTFRSAAPVTSLFNSPRAWAFTILGLTNYLEVAPKDRFAETLRNKLVAHMDRLFHQSAGVGWEWFELSVTYDNAKLPQAMLAAARQTGHAGWLQTAIRSLHFLAKAQSTPQGYFRPVGSNGFWQRGRQPAQWDQQPLEAQAMAATCLEAHQLTGQSLWLSKALQALAWFTGANDLGISLGDPTSGACCDGLQQHGVNLNFGAESTLAWLQTAVEMRLAEQRHPHSFANDLSAKNHFAGYTTSNHSLKAAM